MITVDQRLIVANPVTPLVSGIDAAVAVAADYDSLNPSSLRVNPSHPIRPPMHDPRRLGDVEPAAARAQAVNAST